LLVVRFHLGSSPLTVGIPAPRGSPYACRRAVIDQISREQDGNTLILATIPDVLADGQFPVDLYQTPHEGVCQHCRTTA
jgi:hypothetical protein